MTKLHQRQLQQQPSNYHQRVTLNVSRGGAYEWMTSSLSDISELAPPPPADDDAAQLISRIYGIGRKPTTIALTFRPPRKQRCSCKLPTLVTKGSRSKARRPDNVTLRANDATVTFADCSDGVIGSGICVSCRGHASHVTSQRQRRKNGALAASKSMHSLSSSKPELNRLATGNELQTSERYQTMISSPEADVVRKPATRLSSSGNHTNSTSCVVPRLTLTSAEASDVKSQVVSLSRHQISPAAVSDKQRRSSTPALQCLQPGGECDRLSPGCSSLGTADLPPKPRLDSLFNTHGDLAKFRQLLRESTDETTTEERVNYCCDATTARIEAWLRAVRAARRAPDGLCRQTADQSIESEQATSYQTQRPND